MKEDSEPNELENNKYFSKIIKEDLDLKSNPVAIKFALHREDIPKNLGKIGEKIRHCEMVQKAVHGNAFYSTSAEHLCKGGSAAIGLEKIPEKIGSGEFYYNLRRFKSLGSAKRTIDSIPKITLNVYGIIYMPLEKANFMPDIVVIVGTPAQAMRVTQAIVYTLGGRVESCFSGIQSVCADAVARPFISKRANITMGCDGSRQNADIKNEELIIGLNGENLGCIVNALNNI